MKRLVVKSFKEDLNGFLNLVPNRINHINESSNEPLPKEYGVNSLASELHPSEIVLTVSSVTEISDKVKILTLKSDTLPFFRSGQNINIKNAGFSAPFSLLSSPESDNYEIAVFEDSKDGVSQYLFNAEKGNIITASGPEGLFYYISLRDKNNVTAFCDNHGAPALISMAKSISCGIDKYNLKIVYFDTNNNFVFRNILEKLPVPVEYVSDFPETKDDSCKYFISGTSDFCSFAANKLPEARINVVNPPQHCGEATEEHHCTVIYRDRKFVFTCKNNETLLSAFERNSVPSAAKCNVGECGYCRCKLIKGEVETINISSISSLRQADKKYNFIHPCRSFARTDLILAL